MEMLAGCPAQVVQGGGGDTTAAASSSSSSSRAHTEHLRREYSKEPAQWWDNRHCKTHLRAPDFKHKLNKKSLWMDGRNNPSWVQHMLRTRAVTEESCATKDMHIAQENRDDNNNSGSGGGWETLNLEEALASLEEELLLQPSFEDIACILHKCLQEKNQAYSLRLHAYLCKRGLETHPSLGNYLVLILVKAGRMSDAQQLFDRLANREGCSWNCLITGYIRCGELHHALILYQQMQENDCLHPTRNTFMALLMACSELKDIDWGSKIHAHITTRGYLDRDAALGSTLVTMYAKCGLLTRVQEVFDKLPVRNTVSWNALMSGYTKHGHGEEALNCFNRMQHDGISPNAISFVCSLKACGSIGARDKGQEIHAEVERKGLLQTDLRIGNALIDMYAKCGFLAKAQEVFDKLPTIDVVTWNILIAGYAEHGCCEEALNCLKQMQLECISPNDLTFICSLKACGSIGAQDKGQEIHAEIVIKELWERDLRVGNALVDMYTKCGLLADAQEVFAKLPVRDVVTWTALIAGYVEHGHSEEALNCFEQMKHEGVSPDSAIFAFSLRACGTIGATDKGQEIHAVIARKGLLESDLVGNALVDMYLKCGLLAEAQEVFGKLPKRDVISWTALIAQYDEHGHGEQVSPAEHNPC